MPATAVAPKLAPSELVESLNWRYAAKKFDPAQVIAPDVWSALEEALVLTPSSFGLQPWKFFVVTDRATKEQLVPHSWGQRQVADCSHLVVFGQKLGLAPEDADRLIARTAAVRGVPEAALEGYRKMMHGFIKPKPQSELDAWNRNQVYLALSQFMVGCALLGVDTCPMEGFAPSEYDRILGLKAKGYTAAVICPAGYRAADDESAGKAKVRFSRAEVVEEVRAG